MVYGRHFFSEEWVRTRKASGVPSFHICYAHTFFWGTGGGIGLLQVTLVLGGSAVENEGEGIRPLNDVTMAPGLLLKTPRSRF